MPLNKFAKEELHEDVPVIMSATKLPLRLLQLQTHKSSCDSYQCKLLSGRPDASQRAFLCREANGKRRMAGRGGSAPVYS